MILYCLRHGQAEHNINRLMNGDSKELINLTVLGKQQCSEAREKLKNIYFDIIISSEFPRAFQTAEIIKGNKKIEIKIDERINEVISGMEGQAYLEYVKRKEEISKEKVISRRDVRINGGESFNDVKKRVSNFLNDLKTKDYKIVLVVSHYDPIIALDEVIVNSPSTILPKNCEIFKFEI